MVLNGPFVLIPSINIDEYRCEPDHFLLTSITFGLIYLEKQYALEISTTKSSKKYVNDSLGSYETTGIGRWLFLPNDILILPPAA